MDESLVATTVISALVGAIAGFLAGRLRPGGSDQRVTPEQAVGVLFLTGTKQVPIAKVVPDPIRVKKNGKIDWVVVELVDLDLDLDKITFDWVSQNPLDSVHPVKEHKLLKGKLKVDALGKYRYKVKIDNHPAGDPDIEIMQF